MNRGQAVVSASSRARRRQTWLSARFAWRLGIADFPQLAAALLLMLTGLPGWSATPNQQPTLAVISDVTVLEDSGVQGIPLSGISDGGDTPAQNLTITAVSDNPTVLLNPTVVFTSPAATATLLLAPVSDQFGTAVVTVTVSDDGGIIGGSLDRVSRTFTVTILPVNDPPASTAPADRTISEDGPLQTVTLNELAAGAANESGQTITVTALSSHPLLIPHPSVSYSSPAVTGTLTFTPLPHVSGTATILVTISDDGGTANGGLALTIVSFTVTVLPIAHVPVVVTNSGLALPIATSAVIARAQLEVGDFGPAAQLTYQVVTAPSAGAVRLGGVALTSGGTFTQADINAGLLVYTHTGVSAVSDGLVFTVTNAEGNSLGATAFGIAVSGIAGATTPFVTLPSGAANWVQGGGPVLIDSGATVVDASGTLVGGTLTVGVVANLAGSDVLSIRQVGSDPGQITVSGGVVTYGGSTIGTATGGSGSALSVALAGTATPDAVQALLRNIRFTSTAAAPSAATRTVQVILTNGTSGVSAPVTTEVQMSPVNQPPLVTLPKLTVAYLEASGAVVLDDTATVSDSDSPSLAGGVLNVTWIANATADDLLAIRPQGAGANQIEVIGSAVWWNGSQIATVSGGAAGSALVASLDAAATPAAVQALLRNLTFANPSATPSLALRELVATVSDGAGATSLAANLTVVVQASDNPPMLTLPSPPPTWLQGSPAQVVDALAVVTDVDSSAFNTGLLVAELTAGGTADDRLSILSEGSAAGEIDVVGSDVRWGGTVIGVVTQPGTISSGLVVRLDGDATVAATQALLRRLAFANVAGLPVAGSRSVRVYLTDGAGGTSLPVTVQVAVQAVNAAPVVVLSAAAVAWSEHDPAVLIDGAATISDADSASLAGGTLTLVLGGALAGDELSLRPTGVGAGQVALSGGSVLVSGVAVGTFSGGVGITPLTVAFSAQGTPAAAQAVLRVVQYQYAGQFTAIAPRTLTVTVSDGIDTGVAATATLTLTPVDDPPTTAAVTFAGVVEVPLRGVLPGSDPESGALTWEIVSAPAAGTLTLTAASGAVTFMPDAGQIANATFTFRVGDGVSWSVPATATIRLSARLGELRPLIVSTPPREGVIGTTLSYLITIDGRDLPPGADLRYQVVSQPAGATVVITRTTATTATLTWDQSGAPDQHREVGVVVSDAITGTASHQSVQVLWLAVAPGGAG